MGKEGSTFLSRNVHFYLALSSRTFLCISKGQWLLAQKIAQCSPWACNPSQLKLCIAPSLQLASSLDWALCISSIHSYLPNSPDFLFHNSGSQLPNLPEEIVQSCSSVSHVCVVSFHRVALFLLTDFLLCMFLVSRYFRCSFVSMASKRIGS